MDVAATIVAALIALIAGFLGGWLLRGRTEHSPGQGAAQLAALQGTIEQNAVQHELERTRALAARDAEHSAALVREAETRAALQAELAGLDSTVDELRAQLEAA